MKCFIETWKARDAWMNLSKEERGNYLSQMGPGIQTMVEKGAEMVNWGVNENSTTHRANYDFFAVWRLPSQEMVEKFEEMVDKAGWYDYFEQVNISGEATTPEEVVGKLLEL